MPSSWVWRVALVARFGAVCRGTVCLGLLNHNNGVPTRPTRSFAQELMPSARSAIASASSDSLGPAVDDQVEVASEQPEERYGRIFQHLLPMGGRPGEPQVQAHSASCLTLLQRKGFGLRFLSVAYGQVWRRGLGCRFLSGGVGAGRSKTLREVPCILCPAMVHQPWVGHSSISCNSLG